MEIAEIGKLLETIGIPVSYRAFEKEQKPPYICYMRVESNNFAADGVVYHKNTVVHIELYTKTIDVKLEDKVEEVLSSFFYEKSENYIKEEKIYQIVYEMEV